MNSYKIGDVYCTSGYGSKRFYIIIMVAQKAVHICRLRIDPVTRSKPQAPYRYLGPKRVANKAVNIKLGPHIKYNSMLLEKWS